MKASHIPHITEVAAKDRAIEGEHKVYEGDDKDSHDWPFVGDDTTKGWIGMIHYEEG